MTPSTPPATFGEWVRARRRQLDLTQAGLGERAGCSAAAVRKIEAGERRPSRELAELLARILDIPAAEREVFLQLARGRLVEIPISTEPGRATPPENLPAPLTSLVDRQRDVKKVAASIQDPAIRWVTLIGPPGIGKTRLSIQTGRVLVEFFADGVWFVDLALLEKADFVLPAIARSLSSFGIPPSPGLDQVATILKGKQLLMVLDNFEHIPAAALDVVELLKRCSGLKVLATSRIPLDIYGEHQYPVPPLSIPPVRPSGDPGSLLSLLSYEAVQLLVARIRQHAPSFTLDSRNAAQIADICATLEGIPLALELAAATLQSMDLVELSGMLHHLQGGNWSSRLGTPARDIPSRQRTLENVVAWSHALLTDPQRELFRRLAVFADWFDLPAAETVCSISPWSSQDRIHDLLVVLTDHSMLVQGGSQSKPRWRMLEIVREYASLQLDGLMREGLEIRRAAYLLEKMASLKRNPADPEREPFVQLHTGDVLGAMQWAISGERIDLGFQLMEYIESWSTFGYLREGLVLMEKLLSKSSQVDAETRASALQTAADLAWQQYDFEKAVQFTREIMELARLHGLEEKQVICLNRLGRIYIEQGKYAEALAVLSECLVMASRKPDWLNPGSPLAQLGELALFQGRVAEAEANLKRAIDHLSSKDEIFLAMSLTDLAEVYLECKDLDLARVWLRKALDPASHHIRRWLVFLTVLSGYVILTAQKDPGVWKSAARLQGAVEMLHEHSGVTLSAFYRTVREQRERLARGSVPAADWESAVAEGRLLSRDALLQLASQVLG